jgi:hypothetical protein
MQKHHVLFALRTRRTEAENEDVLGDDLRQHSLTLTLQLVLLELGVSIWAHCDKGHAQE